ncbi:unnamed protein product [Zymoseptoria tritici ST99CH_1E4]|uniref:RING-type domain-containing protein n=1 Tax=Zymoseptoria tritici ST99CH_1E4 TaxID=1276532 RepID=A0A2H1FXK3_ZYMTR|nr:unnamed protein product [Zymoseptoria tritici ST99CH_1E4]
MSDWGEVLDYAVPIFEDETTEEEEEEENEENTEDPRRTRRHHDEVAAMARRPRGRDVFFLDSDDTGDEFDGSEDEGAWLDRLLAPRGQQDPPPPPDSAQPPPPPTRASGSAAIHNILNDDPPEVTTNTGNHGQSHDRGPDLTHSPPTHAPPLNFGDIFRDQTFNHDSDSDEFLTLEAFDPDNTTHTANPTSAAMPTAARRTATSRRQSVVDLTSNSPPEATRPSAPARVSRQPPTTTLGSRGRKRSADSTGEGDGLDRVLKRSRRMQGPVEEVDLLDENPSVEEELRQAQQQATIRAQQAEVAAGPQKIGKRQCIICMENYTNATATACGHFYCHECLIQALLAGEKNSDRGTGTCPVCRKPLSRTGKKKYDIIPIAFMKKTHYVENERRRNMT